MDPLSVAASVAGLCALTVQLVTAVDSIVRNVKTQPELLLNMSQELAALQLVLERLEKSVVSRQTPSQDDEALISVLDGCKGTYHSIGKELALLQENLKKKRVVKLYTQMTFSSRLKHLNPLRDQLEKYKATLIIALHLRTLETSPEDLLKEIANLRVDLKTTNTQPILNETRLGAIQQYLMTTSNVVERKRFDFDKSSDLQPLESPISNRDLDSATISSSATLVPQSSASSVLQLQDPPKPALETFQSFQDWLGTFAPENEHGNHSVGETDIEANLAALRLGNPELQNRSKVVTSPNATLPKLSSSSTSMPHEVPEEIDIEVTIPTGNGNSDPQVEKVSVKRNSQIYELIEKLHSRGHKDICGFRLDESTSVGPIAAFESAWPVVVTTGSSRYSFEDGLLVNQDESLAEFYDNILTMDPLTHQPRSTFFIDRKIHGVMVTDFSPSVAVPKVPELSITFDRTLRVPEDGQTYHLPAILGTLPVLVSDHFRHKLPGVMAQKGGVLIPLYQREALVISLHSEGRENTPNYAIKVFAGSVNAISGISAPHSGPSLTQDYIIAPPQQRLDGFCSEKGIVKQFVSMPIGSDYTAESQVTGKEWIGGLQMQIAQQFKGTGHFSLNGHQTEFGSLHQKDISGPDSLDRFKTPRQLGLEPGRRIFVEGDEVIQLSKLLTVDQKYTKVLSHTKIFPRCDKKCRSTFIHELYTKSGYERYPRNRALRVGAIRPLSITVEKGYDKRERFSGDDDESAVMQYYSQFLDVVDFKNILHDERKRAARYIFFNGIAHDDSPVYYDPIENYNLDGGVISFSHAWMSARMGDGVPNDIVSTEKLKTGTWEMGLAAGGGIHQEIHKDLGPQLWNWKKSVFINVQMLNTVIFETVTGRKAPPCPISFQDYIKGRLPFYHIIPILPMEGSIVLENLRTVGELDRLIEIPIGLSMRKDSGPSGCAICQKGLCDTIVQPCSHIFCYNCIQTYMMKSKPFVCGACRQSINEVVEFAAPMELPVSKTPLVSELETKEDTFVDSELPDQKPPDTSSNPEGFKILVNSLKLNPSSPDYMKLLELVQSIQNGLSSLQSAAQSGKEEEVIRLIGNGVFISEPAAEKGGRTALQAASENGHLSIVRLLLKAGASCNEDPASENGLTSLQAASSRGHLEVVRALISAGAMVNALPCRVNGMTALQSAAVGGHSRTLQYLIKAGANVKYQCCQIPYKISDHENCPGLTALHFAILNGEEAITEHLLEVFRKLNLAINLDLGLLIAARNGHYGIVKILLAEGANPKIAGEDRTTPLHEAARNGHKEIAILLLDHGADINARQEEGETAISLAARSNHDEMLQLLILKFGSFEPWDRPTQKHRFIFRPKKLFEPALHVCAKTGDEAAVRLLLNLGFDSDGNTKGVSETPLYQAAENGHTKIIDLLLDNGADISGGAVALDGNEITPLHLAAQSGHLETVRLLLSRGLSHKTPCEGGYEALHAAAFTGQASVVKLLINEGADPNASSRFHGTPLHQAAVGGSDAVVRLLMTYGADPVALDDNQTAPLDMAVGYENIMQMLLDAGADPNNHDRQGRTPLQRAISKGCLASVRLLIAQGADVFEQSRWDGTLFHHLASPITMLNVIEKDAKLVPSVIKADEREAIALLLLEHGLDINEVNGTYDETALDKAIQKRDMTLVQILLNLGARVESCQILSCGDVPEIVRVLLEHGFDPKTVSNGEQTPLHEAAENGWAEIIRLLVTYGALVDVRRHGRKGGCGNRSRRRRNGRTQRAACPNPGQGMEFEETPLHLAAAKGHLTAVSVLLESGADANARGIDGETALHLATASKHSRVVWRLIQHGAEVDISGARGTALQIASQVGKSEIVRMLLGKGADVNASGGEHQVTALQQASLSGSADIVRLLLNHKAKVNDLNELHGSALHAASAVGSLQSVKILLNHGANVNALSGEYYSVLQAASASGHTDVVKILLDHEADIHVVGGRFGTALQAASSNGPFQMVELLLAKGADVNVDSGDCGNALRAALLRLRNKKLPKKSQWSNYEVSDSDSLDGHDPPLHEKDGATNDEEDNIMRIIKALLDNGANVNDRSGTFGTAIQIASQRGYANVEAGDYNPPLVEAAIKGHVEVCELLLKYGADYSASDKYGHGALHYAALKNNLEIVNAILAVGASSQICPNCGKTPVHLAASKGNIECLDALLGKKFDIDAGDRFGATPLHVALAVFNKVSMEFLVSRGARIDIHDSSGRTALDWAVSMGLTDITELLGGTTHTTPAEVQHQLRKESIAKLGAELRKSSFKDQRVFYALGRCLALLNDMDSASNALKESVYLSHDITFSVSCSRCTGSLARSWYICISCPETDLCRTCLDIHSSPPQSGVYLAGEELPWCSGHKFSVVTEDDYFHDGSVSDTNSSHFERVVDVPRRISRDEFPGNESDSLSIDNILRRPDIVDDEITSNHDSEVYDVHCNGEAEGQKNRSDGSDKDEIRGFEREKTPKDEIVHIVTDGDSISRGGDSVSSEGYVLHDDFYWERWLQKVFERHDIEVPAQQQ